MIRVTATVTAIAVLAAASANAQSLVVSRAGSRPVRTGAGAELHRQRAGRDAVRGRRPVARERRHPSPSSPAPARRGTRIRAAKS